MNELKTKVLDQDKKIAVLADEFGMKESRIRAAIREHDDIAERVDDAPDTDITELRTRLTCVAFGEYEQYVNKVAKG